MERGVGCAGDSACIPPKVAEHAAVRKHNVL